MELRLNSDQATSMKGLAIMMIAIHNFLHISSIYVKENESVFNQESPKDAIYNIITFSDNWFGDLFSFFGWYGVPIFMFMTGYGLVQKYEYGSGIFYSSKRFLLYNYKKLFVLMLPAMFLMIAFPQINNDVYSLGYIKRMLFHFTFLYDLIYFYVPPTPGVYWYFGLTLQFYVVYWFLLRNNTRKARFSTVLFLILSIVIQSVFAEKFFNIDNYTILKYIRHNFIGWFAVFAAGIYLSRNQRTIHVGTLHYAIIAFFAMLLFIGCQFEPTLWQLTPLLAVLLLYTMSIVLGKNSRLSDIMKYLGIVSPCVFVIHPLIRSVIWKIVDVNQHVYIAVFIYVAVLIVCSHYYKKIIDWLGKQM